MPEVNVRITRDGARLEHTHVVIDEVELENPRPSPRAVLQAPQGLIRQAVTLSSRPG
jgi:hypothetical protein